MFQIDDKFVDDLGLSALSKDEKDEFAKHIRNELEMRVGERLTDGMSDESLDEFGYFVDANEDGMRTWLSKYVPDYASDQAYQELKDANPDAPETALMSEFGALKWLQINRPDYPQVVQNVLNELRNEIIASKDAILQGMKEAA